MYISHFRIQKDNNKNNKNIVIAGFLILLGLIFILFSAIIALVMYHNGLVISSLAGVFFFIIGIALSKQT